MALKTDQRTIGEHLYTVTQMPPTKAVPYHFELGTLLAEVIAPLAKEESLTSISKEVMSEALAIAATAMRANLTPARFLAVAQDWTASGHVHRDGVLVDFDQDSAGSEMPNLYKLMAFILEVNFSDFLGGVDLRAIASAAISRASTSPDSPPTSTGTSGE